MQEMTIRGVSVILMEMEKLIVLKLEKTIPKTATLKKLMTAQKTMVEKAKKNKMTQKITTRTVVIQMMNKILHLMEAP